MASNFLRMLFGQGTEPTYAGLRMPRQRVEDDAMLIRQGNPQERYRDYHAELPPLTETEKVAIQGAPMEAPNSRTDNAEAKNQKIKGAIKGVGAMFADAIAQQQAPQSPLQFAQLQQQQLTPLIDPRFMQRRARGGKVKKGQPYLVGEEGAEVVVPEEDGKVVPNDEVSTIASMLGTKVLPREHEAIPSFEQFQASRKAEQPVNMGEDVQATEQVTPNSVTETVTEEPSIADLLRQKMEVRQKRLAEGATKNPDGTTMYGGKQYRKRNAFDALKSAGLGVLQSLATAQVNPNDPNPLSSMLGRAIGGAGAGAVMGATMNNVDERMMDKMKLAQLAPQYEQAYGMERQKKEDDAKIAYKKANAINIADKPQRERDAAVAKVVAAKTAFDRRMQMRDRDADIRSGEAKRTVDANGMVWKEFTKADSSGKIREKEPVVNPVTGEQDFDPGEQMVIDPLTQVKVKAKTIIAPQAMIATGNANRQTEADKTNAAQRTAVMKENINNQMQRMTAINTLWSQAITADSGIADESGIRSEMDGKMREITALSNSELPASSDPEKAQEDRVKRVNKLVDEYNELNNKLITNISKSTAGKAKAEQIKQLINAMPAVPKLTYTPYKPTMVTGGKYAGQSFPSPQAVQKAFPGKSIAEIKAIVEGQGGRFLN